jgi:hypothetical protein
MPTYKSVKYLSLPQQVQQNKEDIATNIGAYDEEYIELQAKDIEQDERLDENMSDIEQLQDAVSSGGVIVSRRISLLANLTTLLAETKIIFDEEISASNDVTAVTKDSNNDTVLITEGKYKFELSSTISNGFGGAETVTFNVYTKDFVTTVETLLATDTIAIGSGETVNKTLQVDYTRISGNNQIIIVKALASTNDLTISENLCNHITSYFTTAGSGVVTQSRNIAPTTVADEGLLGTETTQAEMNEGYKARLDAIQGAVQNDGANNLNMTNTGRITNVADPVSNQDVVTKAYFVANPTGSPYTTDGITVETPADESPTGIATIQSNVNKDVTQRINGVVVYDKDDSGLDLGYPLGIRYGDVFFNTNMLDATHLEIYFDLDASTTAYRCSFKMLRITGSNMLANNTMLTSSEKLENAMSFSLSTADKYLYLSNVQERYTKSTGVLATIVVNDTTVLPIVKIIKYYN